MDLSQAIDRTGFRTDGLVMTLCTSSVPWAMSLGRKLSVSELRFISGVAPLADFGEQTEASCRKLLGNQMHASDVGVIAGINVMMALGCLPVP